MDAHNEVSIFIADWFNYKVVFITNNGGEFTYAKYFKYAAEKIGWEVQIYYAQILGHEAEILKFDPDFIIFSQFIKKSGRGD